VIAVALLTLARKTGPRAVCLYHPQMEIASGGRSAKRVAAWLSEVLSTVDDPGSTTNDLQRQQALRRHDLLNSAAPAGEMLERLWPKWTTFSASGIVARGGLGDAMVQVDYHAALLPWWATFLAIVAPVAWRYRFWTRREAERTGFAVGLRKKSEKGSSLK
jgi:hypothetical protein